MKSFGTRYVARHTRTAAIPADFKHLPAIIKRGLIGAVLLGLFAVSVNMLVKTVVAKASSVHLEIKLPVIKMAGLNLFSEDKYLIEDNGRDFVVNSSGKIRPADAASEGKYLVRLIGIGVDEKREDCLKVFKQALSIDRKYLAEASDINLKNLKNIMMVTADGGTVYFGDTISNERMDNYLLAINKLRETGKRFKTMSLTYKDMVIIK